MKNSIQVLSVAAIVGATFIFSACNNNQTDSKAIANESNEAKFDTRAGEKNAAFMVDAVNLDNASIELANIATQKSNNTEVKTMAAKMEAEHTKTLESLRSLATTKAITIPAEVANDEQRAQHKLMDESGSTFDKKWVDEMLDNHDATIKLYDNAINKDITDPDIKSWLQNNLPNLKAHHESLKILKDKLK